MQQMTAIARFAWQRQKAAIRLGLIAFLLVLIVYSIGPIWKLIFQTQDLLVNSGVLNGVTAAFTFATFVVAVLVWWGEVKEDWEEGLPKRLTVVFLFKSLPAMVCEDAMLVAEGDIRAMAQQLGAQIVGDRSLVIDPFLTVKEPQLLYTDEGWIKRFEIHMPLGELPQKISNKRDEQQQPDLICIRRKVGGAWVDIWQSRNVLNQEQPVTGL